MTRFTVAIKWLGGALFVAALGMAAHAYAVTWSVSRPLDREWERALLIDTLLLTSFAFHHSLFARDAVKASVARLVPVDLVRSAYVWVASLLLMAVVWMWQPLGGEMYQLGGIAEWVLRVTQVAGLALVWTSVAAIDGLELAGIHPPRPAAALSVRWPYSFVRHPLYLGWILIVFAAPHMTVDRLVFAVLTTIYLVVAVRWEERSLRRAHGDAYTQYALRVKWRLVPLLY